MHIALLGRSVRCMWHSVLPPNNSAPITSEDAECRFELLTPNGSLLYAGRATGTSYSYASSAGGFQGLLHEVIIPDVIPSGEDLAGKQSGFRLKYQCRDASSPPFDEYREIIELFSRRTHGNRSAIALVADMGVLESEDTMASMKTTLDLGDVNLAMVVHSGDISYADDRLSSSNWQVWVEFLRRLQPIPQHVLYMTAPGNHEAQFNFTAYHNWFHMPHAQSNSSSPDYYSFDYLGVHFSMISTEMDFQKGSMQHDWLEADMKKANMNRDAVPWLVVSGHRPLYCSSILSEKRCRLEAPVYRSYIEDLLLDNQVDVYLAGHNHQYERSYPMYDGVAVQQDFINPRAPVYIVNGGAGNIEGNDHTFLPSMAVPWRAAHGTHHTGWMTMIPTNSKLSFFYTESRSNEIVDKFEIVRTH
ncbi:acid phosphatase type 7-like [Sycon ciliatum]|uniref:acid phosphatase type 7-like n=1 Tax=Sycon ciliatum TaxID=27933 RepID=UPI0031F6BD94